jgi:hypothetical protein
MKKTILISTLVVFAFSCVAPAFAAKDTDICTQILRRNALSIALGFVFLSLSVKADDVKQQAIYLLLANIALINSLSLNNWYDAECT